MALTRSYVSQARFCKALYSGSIPLAASMQKRLVRAGFRPDWQCPFADRQIPRFVSWA